MNTFYSRTVEDSSLLKKIWEKDCWVCGTSLKNDEGTVCFGHHRNESYYNRITEKEKLNSKINNIKI